MASKDKHTPSRESSRAPDDKKASPEWANGLRHLYDSVVDEPLPDSFKDLLAKLDEADEDGTSASSSKTEADSDS